MLRIARTIPAAIVLAVALAGCTASAPAAPEPASAAASKPAATASTAVSRPVQAFDGLCANLFTVDELGTAIGSDIGGLDVKAMEPQASTLTGVREPRGAATVQAGGVECSWSYPNADTADAPALWAVVTPMAAKVEIEYPDDCDTGSFSGATCEMSAVASGYQITFDMNAAVAAKLPAVEAAADRVSALFAQKAVHAAPDTVAPPATGVWSAADCEALAADPAVIAALGDSSLVGGPSDDSMGAPGTESTGYAACTWSNVGSKYFSVQMLPGGAWAKSVIAGSPDAVHTVDSILGDVITVGESVHVFNGANWLEIVSFDSTTTDATAYAAAAAIIKSLNAS